MAMMSWDERRETTEAAPEAYDCKKLLQLESLEELMRFGSYIFPLRPFQSTRRVSKPRKGYFLQNMVMFVAFINFALIVDGLR